MAMTFVTKAPGPYTWHLTDEQIKAWDDVYTGCDVLGECHKAQAWLRANYARRKTARGMPRFLVGWLSRASERRPEPVSWRPGQRPPHVPWTCPHVEPCNGRSMCANKITLGTARYPLRKAEAS